MSNYLTEPFVKWVGGKRQLLPEITKYFPDLESISTYYEPFLGGGAVLLNVQPEKAIVNDYNEELITAYKVIKNNVDELIEALKVHKNEEQYFYDLRAEDRHPDYESWSDVAVASRLIFLNKTCYNGLYRVNQQGYFNTPFGKYEDLDFINEDKLRKLNKYFNDADIKFLSGDYEKSIKYIRNTAFVYFDPPYAPLNKTSNFTGYTANGFNKDEQKRLRDVCVRLHKRGVKFLMSNSNSDLINDLYGGYGFHIKEVGANRSINSVGSKRGEVQELLIYNYDI